MYPALFLLPLQMLICYTLPNPNGFSKSNFLATVFHFSFDFLCSTHIRASGAFTTFWPQPVQGNSSSVQAQGNNAGSLACGCIAQSSHNDVGLPQGRVCARRLSLTPEVCRGLWSFCFLPKWLWCSWHQSDGAAYSLIWNEVNECLLGISLIISLLHVACHKPLLRWLGASPARCVALRNGTKTGKHNFGKGKGSSRETWAHGSGCFMPWVPGQLYSLLPLPAVALRGQALGRQCDPAPRWLPWGLSSSWASGIRNRYHWRFLDVPSCTPESKGPEMRKGCELEGLGLAGSVTLCNLELTTTLFSIDWVRGKEFRENCFKNTE